VAYLAGKSEHLNNIRCIFSLSGIVHLGTNCWISRISGAEVENVEEMPFINLPRSKLFDNSADAVLKAAGYLCAAAA
jgi:hypothetical protein